MRLGPLFLCSLLISPCMKATPPPPALECRLEAVPPLSAGGPVAVRFTLTNRSDSPVWVLRWNTPLEERWKGTVFTVTRGGTELPYQGPMVKRGDPGRDEYVEIAAGESVSGTADLAVTYDMAEAGEYRVKVTGGLHDVATEAASVPRPRDRHQLRELGCGEIAVEVQ